MSSFGTIQPLPDYMLRGLAWVLEMQSGITTIRKRHLGLLRSTFRLNRIVWCDSGYKNIAWFTRDDLSSRISLDRLADVGLRPKYEYSVGREETCYGLTVESAHSLMEHDHA